jgi:hypothetical protein
MRRARRLIATRCLFGVDKDPLAVELAKLSLWLFVGDRNQPLNFLDHNLRCGDALQGEPRASPTGGTNMNTPRAQSLALPTRKSAFHWPGEFPEVFAGKGGFHAVLANPPWGQKSIQVDPKKREFLRRNFPSCAGIFDLFRPFVERSVQLLAPGGALGMVLPDIILLKNYPATRKFLLDHVTLLKIDWWGDAFATAAIDTVTLSSVRARPLPGHLVRVCLHRAKSSVRRRIRQESFQRNPSYMFNLHLTTASQRILDRVHRLAGLGDYFEIHEGVHSGNLRFVLFVDERLDETCKQMYFGRNEIRPYVLDWHGRYFHLGALPKHKTNTSYANAGRAHWFQQPKILVRRTGDFVLAALDSFNRYASNNFFVVFPKTPCALDLFGLCALLNSRFMTWFFRTIEPRQGRLFAELKIKHLRRFPLPEGVMSVRACRRLNQLGRRRAIQAASLAGGRSRAPVCVKLDHAIDVMVPRLLGVDGLLPGLA